MRTRGSAGAHPRTRDCQNPGGPRKHPSSIHQPSHFGTQLHILQYLGALTKQITTGVNNRPRGRVQSCVLRVADHLFTPPFRISPPHLNFYPPPPHSRLDSCPGCARVAPSTHTLVYPPASGFEAGFQPSIVSPSLTNARDSIGRIALFRLVVRFQWLALEPEAYRPTRTESPSGEFLPPHKYAAYDGPSAFDLVNTGPKPAHLH